MQWKLLTQLPKHKARANAIGVKGFCATGAEIGKLAEIHAVGVLRNGDSLNNGPDVDYHAQEATGEDGNQKLGNSLADVTGIEVMNAEAAEKQSQDYIGHARLRDHDDVLLIVRHD